MRKSIHAGETVRHVLLDHKKGKWSGTEDSERNYWYRKPGLDSSDFSVTDTFVPGASRLVLATIRTIVADGLQNDGLQNYRLVHVCIWIG